MGEHKPNCAISRGMSSGNPDDVPCTCTPAPDVDALPAYRGWIAVPINRHIESRFKNYEAGYLAGHAQGRKEQRAVDVGVCERERDNARLLYKSSKLAGDAAAYRMAYSLAAEIKGDA